MMQQNMTANQQTFKIEDIVKNTSPYEEMTKLKKTATAKSSSTRITQRNVKDDRRKFSQQKWLKCEA